MENMKKNQLIKKGLFILFSLSLCNGAYAGLFTPDTPEEAAAKERKNKTDADTKRATTDLQQKYENKLYDVKQKEKQEEYKAELKQKKAQHKADLTRKKIESKREAEERELKARQATDKAELDTKIAAVKSATDQNEENEE